MLWKLFDIAKDSQNEKETNQIENIIKNVVVIVVVVIAAFITVIAIAAVNIIIIVVWLFTIFATRVKATGLSRISTASKQCLNPSMQSKGQQHTNLVKFHHRHCLAS